MKLFILALLGALSISASTWATPPTALIEVTAPDGKVTLYNESGEQVPLRANPAVDGEATVQKVQCGGGCGGCGGCGDIDPFYDGCGGGCGGIDPFYDGCGSGCGATPYNDGYYYGDNYYGGVGQPYYRGGYGYRRYGGARRPVYGRRDYGYRGRPVGRPGWGR